MLWWRRRHSEIERGTFLLESWDDLKREIKRQFYPMNAVAEARAKLRHLTHRTTIREYVREFSELLLEVPSMSDEEALFDFIDGLQNWAKLELQRRGPQDLASAIAIAESLIDFGKRESPKSKGKWDDNANGGGDEDEQDEEDSERKPRSPTYRRRAYDEERSKEGRSKSPTHQRKANNGDRGKDRPPLSCFLCEGPHKAMYCPQREKLSSLLHREEAREEVAQGETTMGSLRLLDSIKGKVGAPKPERKGRMYLAAKVNGINTKALLDTGASHNFLEVGEAKRLGITYIKEEGWLKTVNSAVKPIYGVARGVRLHLRDWCGLIDFSVVDMDDYKVVLGVEFLDNQQAFPVPFSNTLCIMGKGNACMVPISRETSKTKAMSSMQLLKASSEVTQVPREGKRVGVVRLTKTLPPREKVERRAEFARGKQRRSSMEKSKWEEPSGQRRKRQTQRGVCQTSQRVSDEGVARFGGGECHDPRCRDQSGRGSRSKTGRRFRNIVEDPTIF